ncbi:thioesterase family protein [Rhodococcus oryzae]|uniref:Thioesterase family protein n=1 Tax=Rhodococcus oryzae TaxID=2571143 RepID=A0ABY2RJB5_9NOCA|nr:thioesterase family protein [Rhodococcus oryzae]TJZ75941.1 thioesterase family protein [Rhodococcus oryzae]
MVGFFTSRGDLFVAEEFAVSHWTPTQVGGHAVCGLLARSLETHCPAGFVPARMTVDLFRPVLNAPIEVRSEVVRQGTRITVADASIVQDGEVRTRASAVFLTTGPEPAGRVWRPDADLPVPSEGCVSPDGAPPLFKSGDREWTHDFAANQNADRKTSWHSLPPLVDGEPISPFQRAAVLGDTTNHVCHWGSHGAGYINTDMTLTLSRLPIGYELGLRAENTVTSAGVSIGTATLYDRTGPLGTCVVTALSNGRRQIDFAR